MKKNLNIEEVCNKKKRLWTIGWVPSVKSKNYVNAIVASKHPRPQWLTMEQAVKHCTQGIGIWDTGATDTVIGKHFADKMGMMVTPRMDGDGNPLTANDVRYIGTTTVKMLIGSVQTPYLLARVNDFDPSGERQESELPDFMIGMDIICHGRFTVDSTGDETVVTFEPDF